ncbi:hypothetical protein TNCV_4616051 [Trichonephila clavipes]|nr:hypothetical protein TNCV_4616051 [Trichonephila clavipes]
MSVLKSTSTRVQSKKIEGTKFSSREPQRPKFCPENYSDQNSVQRATVTKIPIQRTTVTKIQSRKPH